MKLMILLVILSSIQLSNPLLGQSSRIDSLENRLKMSGIDDSTKVQLLVAIGDGVVRTDSAKTRHCLNEIRRISNKM